MTIRFQTPEASSVSGRSTGASRRVKSDVRTPLSPRAQANSLHRFATGDRELRLDLFRGLALCLIFIDHLSPDRLSWITIRSYGFSDAAEIFIFISGYTAALVYGRATFESGFMVGAARVLRRVWQIYAAHLLLFLILIAEIAYATAITHKQSYVEEMGVAAFFDQPGIALIHALVLQFRPLNMDVLPLYVVLMFFVPLLLQLARCHKDLPLALSIALYILTHHFDLHLSTYPNGFWSFNPFAWQLLFVFGAWCALGGARRLAPILAPPLSFWIAASYLLAAFFVTMTWHFPQWEGLIPSWLTRLIYPIDKTDLDILRLAHFLALAVVTLCFIPAGWPGLQSRWLRPLILCGQYSLQIFSLGVTLAFAGYALLMEISGDLMLHAIVAAVGLSIMYGIARTFAWYKWALISRAAANDRVTRVDIPTPATSEPNSVVERHASTGSVRCSANGESRTAIRIDPPAGSFSLAKWD
jgi:hypothetical protein